MNKCACGHKERTIIVLNLHRRECPAFWDSVAAEMRRIAHALYGQPAPVSIHEWTDNHGPGFPGADTMVKMGRAWAEIQRAAGMGTSVHGRGSIAIKRKTRPRKTPEERQNSRLDLAALAQPIMSMPAEAYLAATSGEGLPICEDAYRRTGRMWIR